MKNQTYRMTMLLRFLRRTSSPSGRRSSLISTTMRTCRLAEIAENCGISRQGVRDVIVRAEAAMEELEDKTGLIQPLYAACGDSCDAIEAAANEIKTINYRQYENRRLDGAGGQRSRAEAAALKE